MQATFTQDQRDIEKTIRAMVEGDPVGSRESLDGEWAPPECDTALLGDFGVLGVPESAGGVGSSLVDLMVAVEVLGEHVVPSRYSTHAAAVQLAAALGEVPADVLEGRRVLTTATDIPRETGWPQSTSAQRTLVRYAAQSDGVVVSGAEGVWLAEPGTTRLRESFDPSVPLSDIEVSSPGAPAEAGSGLERATLVVAAELCGVAQGAIGLGAEHARTRQQFGSVIGSFQGVAFQLVEAVTARKAAWDLTLYAAWAVERGRADAEAHVHAAKAAAGKAAIFAAERCIQVHGGMGITMAADPHLYLRRALVLDAVLGRGSWHRRKTGELRIAAHTAGRGSEG